MSVTTLKRPCTKKTGHYYEYYKSRRVWICKRCRRIEKHSQ